MSKLYTTVWLYDRETLEIHQVVEQYRNTYEALGSAYKIMKTALEDVYVYMLFTEQKEMVVEGELHTGVAVFSEEANMGLFIPDAELEEPISPIVMVGGERRSTMTFTEE